MRSFLTRSLGVASWIEKTTNFWDLTNFTGFAEQTLVGRTQQIFSFTIYTEQLIYFSIYPEQLIYFSIYPEQLIYFSIYPEQLIYFSIYPEQRFSFTTYLCDQVFTDWLAVEHPSRVKWTPNPLGWSKNYVVFDNRFPGRSWIGRKKIFWDLTNFTGFAEQTLVGKTNNSKKEGKKKILRLIT